MHETAYSQYVHAPGQTYGEMPHHYGSGVHLLACPVLLSQLATLCQPQTRQPQVTGLVQDLFAALLRATLADVWPRIRTAIATRMAAGTPEDRGIWHGQVLDVDARAVTVDIARAGTVPSQLVFERLNRLLDPERVRQDHVYMNRITNSQGSVIGVDVTGSKIGGDVADAFIFIPDPMGATGSSMAQAVDLYKALAGKQARQIIALNLVVTPEYLRTLSRRHPDVLVYALRLDRGMSPPDIMHTALGARWQDERGLNEHQYIIPGAGGLGEILNNSYV